MSDELAPGRVLHLNDSAWESLERTLRENHFDLMADHVAEQRRKDVVVLDLEVLPIRPKSSIVSVLRQWQVYARNDGPTVDANVLGAIADQIEAQVQKPRIPEPGLWGVVEAARRELDGSSRKAVGKWFRVEATVCPWTHDSGSFTAEWSDLVDPVLVREGV